MPNIREIVEQHAQALWDVSTEIPGAAAAGEFVFDTAALANLLESPGRTQRVRVDVIEAVNAITDAAGGQRHVIRGDHNPVSGSFLRILEVVPAATDRAALIQSRHAYLRICEVIGDVHTMFEEARDTIPHQSLPANSDQTAASEQQLTQFYAMFEAGERALSGILEDIENTRPTAEAVKDAPQNRRGIRR